MTETTKTVFEKYQVRKTKKQKEAFRDYVKEIAEEKGYKVNVEKGYLGAKNIVVGDAENAKVIYTAHYDTCPRLPFPNFITPKSIGIYLLYQLALVVSIVVLAFLFGGIMGFALGVLSALIGIELPYILVLVIVEIPWILVVCLMLFGPANKHTANDNTSGVTLLLDIITTLPEEDREHVAFVFFDLEEMGLFGSAGFASKHKNIAKNIPVVNFDCISDGENILFCLSKNAAYLKDSFESNFQENEKVKVEVLTKGFFYPSDQANFKKGIGVAALKKAKKSNLLYMNRIHTKNDTVYREENIEYLCEGSKNFLKNF